MPSTHIAWPAGPTNLHTLDFGWSHSSDIRGKLCHNYRRRFSTAPHENALFETWASARVNAESQHYTFHRQHMNDHAQKEKAKHRRSLLPFSLPGSWVISAYTTSPLGFSFLLIFILFTFRTKEEWSSGSRSLDLACLFWGLG